MYQMYYRYIVRESVNLGPKNLDSGRSRHGQSPLVPGVKGRGEVRKRDSKEKITDKSFSYSVIIDS